MITASAMYNQVAKRFAMCFTMRSVCFSRTMMFALAVSVSTSAFAFINNYTQDFEGLDRTSSTALGGDGWRVFGNVFNPDGSYFGGYGVFPAPNGGPGFSAIVTGEGGATQGQNQLSIYNDYNNPEHTNGSGRTIESNVFQERTIAAGDLGRTFNFTFDYKASSTNGPSGVSTAQAFFKVLNPNNNFALVSFPTFVTTNASTSWSTGSLSITIDNAWTGHIFQFGFMNTAVNLSNTTVFYDNISMVDAIPEPLTMSVLAAGLLGLAARRRRK
ncbi:MULTISPECIES: PEP-CTERM sorting domain-containing protein [Aphanothece]|uniref:PEP-CTERM sorting domain-containing protein n=1 Tax=Aphanothece stagnina TaxID=1004305 RepID=UPI0039852ACE